LSQIITIGYIYESGLFQLRICRIKQYTYGRPSLGNSNETKITNER